MFDLALKQFFIEVFQVCCACHETWSSGIRSFARRAHETSFCRFQNIVQVLQVLRLPNKVTSDGTSHIDLSLPHIDLSLPKFQQHERNTAPATWMKKHPKSPITQFEVPTPKGQISCTCHRKSAPKTHTACKGELASAIKVSLTHCGGRRTCWPPFRSHLRSTKNKLPNKDMATKHF